MSGKGSAEELERRRLLAAALFGQVLKNGEIAERLEVSLTSFKRWKRVLREGGEEALEAARHLGPKPRLTDEQKTELAAIVRQGAVAAGFANDW